MEKCAVVLALSVWLLLGGSSAAATFSSKLIHRFSDEAKVIWTARNGVVSWPKRNSLEYLELLIGNDWKRQRMKVGSKNQLLFPSQGSQTLFFGNELDWLHYTWIDIGTPNVSFLVALDAGSDLLWVPCDCIQCAPLSASYYNSLDKDLSEYTPSLSSSSKNLSCSHQLCESSSYCKGPNDPCPYIIEYDSANTSSSGYLVEDKLHLKSFIDHAVESSIQASVIIGCGRKQSGGYLDGAAPDGLMGLGPGNVSIPSLLAKAGLIQNSFSICLDETAKALLLSSVILYCYMIGGESGTSFTYLPPEIYDKVVLEFEKQVNARRISNQEDPWKYCYNVSSEEPFKIPGMRLKFAMNQSFEVHNHIYSYTETEGFTVFCLTVLRGEDEFGVIGRQDVSDKSSIHFAPPPSSGSPIPLPTNEQQHNNHTDAVAPAVANSTKPSSASQLQIPTLLCLFSSFILLLLRVLL
ncbi:hypothetical protein V6N13_143418 [Hibiscus sabdariffa]